MPAEDHDLGDDHPPHGELAGGHPRGWFASSRSASCISLLLRRRRQPWGLALGGSLLRGAGATLAGLGGSLLAQARRDDGGLGGLALGGLALAAGAGATLAGLGARSSPSAALALRSRGGRSWRLALRLRWASASGGARSAASSPPRDRGGCTRTARGTRSAAARSCRAAAATRRAHSSVFGVPGVRLGLRAAEHAEEEVEQEEHLERRA